MHACMHACIHTNIHTYIHIYIHTIHTLQYITLHYITLHYITFLPSDADAADAAFASRVVKGASPNYVPCPHMQHHLVQVPQGGGVPGGEIQRIWCACETRCPPLRCSEHRESCPGNNHGTKVPDCPGTVSLPRAASQRAPLPAEVKPKVPNLEHRCPLPP